jgi:hypothetical protein
LSQFPGSWRSYLSAKRAISFYAISFYNEQRELLLDYYKSLKQPMRSVDAQNGCLIRQNTNQFLAWSIQRTEERQRLRSSRIIGN